MLQLNLKKSTPFLFGLLLLVLSYQNCSESSLVLPSSDAITEVKADCTGPSGDSIVHGDTASGIFLASEVGCSETCTEAIMSCDNGKMKTQTGQIITDSRNQLFTSCKATCDHRTVSGNEATAMQPGKPYVVSVYGVTANKGTGITNLLPVRVEDCAGNSLASTNTVNINWHDGQAPQSHSFSITAPSTGCVRGFVDGPGAGEALNLTVSEQKEAGLNSTGAQQTGLQANAKYLVSAYGVTRDLGQNNNTLAPVAIQDCNSNNLIATDTPVINWPDGNVPQSMSLIASAPADGCLQGRTDAGPAGQLSLFKSTGDARTINGSQVTNLVAGKSYLVTAYGVTTENVNEAFNGTLNGVKVSTCNGTLIAETQATNINWHDGSAPQSATLAIEAPTDGCIQASTDAGPAHVITVFQTN